MALIFLYLYLLLVKYGKRMRIVSKIIHRNTPSEQCKYGKQRVLFLNYCILLFGVRVTNFNIYIYIVYRIHIIIIVCALCIGILACRQVSLVINTMLVVRYIMVFVPQGKFLVFLEFAVYAKGAFMTLWVVK